MAIDMYEKERKEKILDGIFVISEIVLIAIITVLLICSCGSRKAVESEHVRTDNMQQSDSVLIKDTGIASEKERERSVTSKTDSAIVTMEKEATR